MVGYVFIMEKCCVKNKSILGSQCPSPVLTEHKRREMGGAVANGQGGH